MEGVMPISPDRDYHFCERIHRYVCVKRTEGQCRDTNRCREIDCPLEHELGRSGSIGTRRWLGVNPGLCRLMPGPHDRRTDCQREVSWFDER